MLCPHDGSKVGVAAGSPTGLPCTNEACEEGYVLHFSASSVSIETCSECRGRGRTPTYLDVDETRLRMDAYTEEAAS